MTTCPRCAELTALADRTRTGEVVCVGCGQTIRVPNPVPDYPYAGCIACYRASRVSAGQAPSPFRVTVRQGQGDQTADFVTLRPPLTCTATRSTRAPEVCSRPDGHHA